MMTWLSSSENIYHRKKTKSMEKLNYICRHSSHSLKGSGFSGDGKIKAMDKIRKQFIDKAVYTFHNTVTGESFTGTRFDFYSKYKLRKSQQMRLSALVRGKRKHVAKWGLTSINHNI